MTQTIARLLERLGEMFPGSDYQSRLDSYLSTKGITDTEGNVISWASSGGVGFSGSRKSTPYAAQMAAEKAGRAAMEQGLRRVEVHVKGPGSGRDTALRSIQNLGIEVSGIKDVTPVPHNGCLQPKRKRP